MRSAGNFSPEWGYLAPAPSFMRTARIVLVATAVGATAGAAVVLSLVDHPATDGNQTSITAHAIVTSVQVTSVQAATPATMPLASAAPAVVVAPISVPPAVQAQIPVHAAVQVPAPQNAPQVQVRTAIMPPVVATPSTAIQSMQPLAVQASSGVGQTNAVSPPPSAPGIAALSEVPPATDATTTDMSVAPEALPGQKKPTKNKATGPNAANGVSGVNSKNKPDPGLGSVLRRLFSARAGNSYYPN
jgi:hypothetical protein